ncbi:FAD-binding oxidoreductase [Azospirillum sp.]|uniref:FAD-binding oxidoreductase n=1 Tax=Azospirillum sp. TaxID=34012 RepID=UPI002D5F30C0|nr:FAD-binding oxidoreductase [Azospirillum sp.]HYD68188.1 FAD-binding oxidoreductase [Azospirillum sp.]
MSITAESTTSLAAALRNALGAEAVLDDERSRAFYANDVFWQPGVPPLAIVLPRTAEEVAAAVRAAAQAGVSIVPRGGGMSYTKGYLPKRPDSIVIDGRKLNRVIELNADDRYVTVETGCTWAALNEALEGTGLRTGYWGPLSGINATIGGALSQNSAFFGSGVHGTVAETVLGVTVVLADGRVVTTGSGGRKGAKPFTRAGGPDLTGLFLGDNGAMGVKVAATLRLYPRPAEVDFLSFGFASIAAMAAAQVEMARTRCVSEGFGIDRTKAEHSASVNKLMDGLKTLGNVAMAGKSLLQGAKDALGVAAAGTAFLKAHNFTLHLVVEGRTREELKHSVETLRAIGTRHGTEIENTVPKVMRSKPFGPVRGMLGRDGERWVPIHAVFPLSMAPKAIEANDAFFAEKRAFMEKHGIIYSVMTMTVGNEFFLEPAFYWQDEITPLHAASLGEDVVRPWRDRPANPEARNAVAELRRATQELYAGLGGVSWQVARDYPFREILAPETWALLEGVKRAVDPQGLMNPGALGLD